MTSGRRPSPRVHRSPFWGESCAESESCCQTIAWIDETMGADEGKSFESKALGSEDREGGGLLTVKVNDKDERQTVGMLRERDSTARQHVGSRKSKVE